MDSYTVLQWTASLLISRHLGWIYIYTGRRKDQTRFLSEVPREWLSRWTASDVLYVYTARTGCVTKHEIQRARSIYTLLSFFFPWERESLEFLKISLARATHHFPVACHIWWTALWNPVVGVFWRISGLYCNSRWLLNQLENCYETILTGCWEMVVHKIIDWK